MRERALYLIGGSALCLPTIRTAQALGWRVLCTDKDPEAPGLLRADERCVLDGTDVEGHLTWARTAPGFGYKIEACYCPADFGLPALRAIRALLGLPDNRPEVYDLLADKQAYLDVLEAGGVLTPRSLSGSRWVLKPRRGSGGSRGVRWATEEEMFLEGSTELLAEPYVEGTHLAVNLLALDGCYDWLGVMRTVLLPGAHPIPMAGWPCWGEALPGVPNRRIYDTLERAARLLGILHGPLKGDVIVTERLEVVVLEVEPRFHGDVSTAGIMPTTGLDPMAKLLGGEIYLTDRFAAWWALWLPEGRLVEEPVLPMTRGVTSLWWNPKVQGTIEAPTSTANIAGYVAMAGKDREDVWRLRDAWRAEARCPVEALGPDLRDDLDGLLLRL